MSYGDKNVLNTKNIEIMNFMTQGAYFEGKIRRIVQKRISPIRSEMIKSEFVNFEKYYF